MGFPFEIPYRPNLPIPNNPFYYPETDAVSSILGPLVIGAGFNVDYATSTISATGGGGGVTSISAGFGISVSSSTGSVTITNTGVRSLTAGSGISLSGTTGDITIANSSPSYGNYVSLVTQTNPNFLTGIPVVLGTVIGQNNFSIVSSSRITPTVAGLYNIQANLQLFSTSFGGQVEVWLRKGGSTVASTNRIYTVMNANQPQDVAVNFVIPLVVGDYVELMWATDNSNIKLTYTSSSGDGPYAPSAAVTITPVGA